MIYQNCMNIYDCLHLAIPVILFLKHVFDFSQVMTSLKFAGIISEYMNIYIYTNIYLIL